MHLVDRLDLPGCYAARPYTGAADHEAMTIVLNEYRELHGIPDFATVEQFDVVFDGVAGSNRADDVALVEFSGEVVAYCRTTHVELTSGHTDLLLSAPTRPGHIGRALFDALLDGQQAHALKWAAAAEHPRYRTRTGHAGPGQPPPDEGRWLADHGFEVTYWDAALRRPHLDDIADLPLPDGIEVRPVEPEHVRDVLVAHHEAFRGEWDFTEADDDLFDEVMSDPLTDITLWQVAWDGDRVVGQVKPFVNPVENDVRGHRRGYTEYISTHHEYRSRGIAGALLARALRALRDRGLDEAVLGTDVHNAGGAFHLYRKLGFVVIGHEAYYTKTVGPAG